MKCYLYHHTHSSDGGDECILDLVEVSCLGDYGADIPVVVALLVVEAAGGSEGQVWASGRICAVVRPVAGAPMTANRSGVVQRSQVVLP
jgi:hypothetical protein